MNKKGSIYLGLALGLMIWITGVLILPFITGDVTTVRVALNCATPLEITSGNKLSCLFVGGLVPYYIWFFSSMALGILIGGFRE